MTIANLDERIIELEILIKEKQSLIRKLSDAKNELKKLKNKKVELGHKLRQEQKDIDQLESTSIVSLWYTVLESKLVSKEERSNKEQKELSVSEHNYKMSMIAIKQIKPEIEKLERKLSTINEYEIKMDDLLRQKHGLMKGRNSETYAHIEELNEKLIRLKNIDQELKQAEIAGNQLKKSIQTVIELMNKANSIGVYDLLGGGLLVSIGKHTYVKKADKHIEHLQKQASQFVRELKAIDYLFDLNIDVSETLKFGDYLFDDLYVDLTMQSRIKDVLHNIGNHHQKVERITSELRTKRLMNMKELKRTESVKNKLSKDL